ncbi:MAG: toll/interleukin-1 receptor domain-containing protein, partial [Oscillospiraceae bacterium]
MKWFTRSNNDDIQGKQLVYITGGEKSLTDCISEQSELKLVERILEKANCAISVGGGVLAAEDIRSFQLVVVIVTAELFTSPSAVINIKAAQELHVPLLPLMMESGQESRFNQLFNDLQCLYPFAQDSTQESFDKKLQDFLNVVLIDDKLEKEVKNSFDGYMFLSYRKKDREYANRLIKLIHRFDFCRDIAIWYDETIIAGENFNKAIEQALINSDIFLLLVTPSILEDGNYVQTIEYPTATANKKPVLPVEMVPTNDEKYDKYNGLAECINPENTELLRRKLAEFVGLIPKKNHPNAAHHTYLMGIAYLYGIDVETDPERGLQLIHEAVEMGSPYAAGKLSQMYKAGQFVEKSFKKSIYWLGKKVELFGSCDDNTADFTEKIIARMLYECELRREGSFEEAEKQLIHLIDECHKYKTIHSDEPLHISWVQEMESRAYNHLALCRRELGYSEDMINPLNEKSDQLIMESRKHNNSMPIDEAIIMASTRIYQIFNEVQNNPENSACKLDEAEKLIESISMRLATEKPSTERRLAQWKRNLPDLWYCKGITSKQPDEKAEYLHKAETAFVGLIKEFPNEPTLKMDISLTYREEFVHYLHTDINKAFEYAVLSMENLIDYYTATQSDSARNLLSGSLDLILRSDSSLFAAHREEFCRGVQNAVKPFLRGFDHDVVTLCAVTLDYSANKVSAEHYHEYSIYLYEQSCQLIRELLAKDSPLANKLTQHLCAILTFTAYQYMEIGEIQNSYNMLKEDVLLLEKYIDSYPGSDAADFAYSHSDLFIPTANIIIEYCKFMRIPQSVDKYYILIIRLELLVCKAIAADCDNIKLNDCLKEIASCFSKLPEPQTLEMQLLAAKTRYFKSIMYSKVNTDECIKAAKANAFMSIGTYEAVFAQAPDKQCAVDYYTCGSYIFYNIMAETNPIAKLDHHIRHVLKPMIYLNTNYPECEDYIKALDECLKEDETLFEQSYNLVD